MNTDLGQAPKVALQIRTIMLRKAAVERLDRLPHEVETAPTVNFGLSVRRPSVGELGVELGLSLVHEDVVRADIVYGGWFVMPEKAQAPSDESLRYFAAKVAPSILYPFIREIVASLTVKAGLPALVLPVLNFEGVFTLDSVVIPPVPERVAEEAQQKN